METCNQQFSYTWGTYTCKLLKGHGGVCQRPIALIPDEGAREATLESQSWQSDQTDSAHPTTTSQSPTDFTTKSPPVSTAERQSPKPEVTSGSTYMTPVGNVGAADGSFSPPSTANYIHIVTDCEQGKEPHQWGGQVISATGQRERVHIRCSLCGRDVLDELSRMTTELAEARRERDETRRKLEREEIAHENTVDQRDEAQQAADNLAYLIAPMSEIGEHSSGNSPWENALENYAPQEDRTQLTRANAVIERVLALLEACDDDTERTPEYGWVLRCDANFVDQLRTILEGNEA